MQCIGFKKREDENYIQAVYIKELNTREGEYKKLITCQDAQSLLYYIKQNSELTVLNTFLQQEIEDLKAHALTIKHESNILLENKRLYSDIESLNGSTTRLKGGYNELHNKVTLAALTKENEGLREQQKSYNKANQMSDQMVFFLDYFIKNYQKSGSFEVEFNRGKLQMTTRNIAKTDLTKFFKNPQSSFSFNPFANKMQIELNNATVTDLPKEIENLKTKLTTVETKLENTKTLHEKEKDALKNQITQVNATLQNKYYTIIEMKKIHRQQLQETIQIADTNIIQWKTQFKVQLTRLINNDSNDEILKAIQDLANCNLLSNVILDKPEQIIDQAIKNPAP